MASESAQRLRLLMEKLDAMTPEQQAAVFRSAAKRLTDAGWSEPSDTHPVRVECCPACTDREVMDFDKPTPMAPDEPNSSIERTDAATMSKGRL